MITLPPLVAYLRVSTAEALFGGWATSNKVTHPLGTGTGTGPDLDAGVSEIGSQLMGQNHITNTERGTA